MKFGIEALTQKDVKNEGRSHLFIENKGAKKVLPLVDENKQVINFNDELLKEKEISAKNDKELARSPDPKCVCSADLEVGRSSTPFDYQKLAASRFSRLAGFRLLPFFASCLCLHESLSSREGS